MKKPTTKDIENIAEYLDTGMRAFYNKVTGETIFLPAEDEDIEDFGLEEEYADSLKKLKDEADDFVQIHKWSSREAFKCREEFADQLTENPQLQTKLFNALNNRKPFSGFRYVIDEEDKYRQQWFDYEANWIYNYVARELRHLE